MMKTKLFLPAVVTASSALLFASVAQAQVIYKQAFDYDSTDDGKEMDDGTATFAGDGWSQNTGTISYQHNAGLSYANYTSAGGAIQYDFPSTGGGRSAEQDMTYDFAGAADGTVFHVFGLADADFTGSNNAEVIFGADGAVNTFGFGITNTGSGLEAYGYGFDNTPNNQVNFGNTSVSANTTVGFLMRITKGTGTSPTDSEIELWINPDMTGVTLGAALPASFDTTQAGTISASKIGREGAANAFQNVQYGGSVAGTWTFDEVNFVQVPEPSTYAAIFGALALAGVMLRRRLRK